MGITRGWAYRVNVKQFLSDNGSDEEAQRIRGLVADELQRVAPFKNGFEDPLGSELIDELREVEEACEFNAVLSLIYDYADDYRIWLGL